MRTAKENNIANLKQELFAVIKFRLFLLASLFMILFVSSSASQKSKSSKKPNIILILVDDLGYSDLGCYGSEINTPNLDKMAANGLRYTNFYNTARCCPTRASLLTGLYAHQTGLGWMTSQDQGFDGYRGQLNNNCVTIAEVLKTSGYSTFALGKWHVSLDADCEENSPQNNWPLQRGFDKFFGFLKGASDYFNPDYLYSGNKHIRPTKNMYLTDAISDTASKFIDAHFEINKNPFFMYLAYNAPHFPLHAKPEDIAKYEKKYLAGWDVIRKGRFEKMKKIGLISKDEILSPKHANVEDWNTLSPEKQKEMAKRMAIYAAQIDCIDEGIGKIIETLKRKGKLENTIIMFVSDNGGCAEPVSKASKEFADLGTTKSYESYGHQWANVSNTPFRIYKRDTHEGGIATPMIVHWPNGIKEKGKFRNQLGHVIDFLPTVLELTNAVYPTKNKGNEVFPYQGGSLIPTFTNNKQKSRTLYFEHIANRGLIENDWKIVCTGTREKPFITPWELFNLKNDRVEMNNLAEKYPEKLEQLSKKWDEWANKNNVLPIDGRGGENRIKKPVKELN